MIPGLILLFLPIYLINRKNETIPVTPRWILYAVLLFIGNGSCSAVQKLQQSVFKGEYKNEFMFLALVLVFTTPFYKEKLSRQQIIRFAIGAVSVVLLNL